MYIEWQILSSLAKVLPGTSPARWMHLDRLSALRGERVSFQVAAVNRRYRNTAVRVKAAGSLTAAGLSPRIREVIPVPVLTPVMHVWDEDYLSIDPGMYPDLLRELKDDVFFVRETHWRSFWVDFTVPADLPAGSYELALDLTVMDSHFIDPEYETSLKVTFDIIDAALPPQKLIHTQWFHGDSIANYYGAEVFSERWWELAGNFMRSARDCGINMILTPILTPSLDTEIRRERLTVQLVDITRGDDSRWSFSFERLERWVRLAQDCGMQYFEMAHLATQWGAVAAPKVMARTSAGYQRVFGWETPSDSPEYTGFLRALLPALTEKIEELGIAAVTYFHISDEPDLKALERYKKLREVIKPLIGDMPIMDALSHYEFYEQGISDCPIPANNMMQEFLDNKVENLWTYYCVSERVGVSNRFISMPSARNRVLGLQMYLYNIVGFLQWGFNFYNAYHSLYPIDPYRTTDAEGCLIAGDPFLVYPGADGKPEDSIRAMVFVEGLQDQRALGLLESLSSREEVEALIHKGVEQKITFERYPRGEQWMMNLRERVNRRIAELI